MSDLDQLETMTDELLRLRQAYLAELQDVEKRVATMRRLAESADTLSKTIIAVIDKLKDARSGDWWKHGGENPVA
jgi:hypothetical protein